MADSASQRGQFIKHAPDDQPAVQGDVQISPLVRHFVTTIDRLKSKREAVGQPTIEVSDSLGVLAFAYEKVRNSIEYREDHVLLRHAIKRILKRRLNPLWQYESIASALLRELIWARYLQNDSVPQSKVSEIEALLRKYNVLRQAARQQKLPESWQDWIIGLAATDIEHVLSPRPGTYALAEVMFQSMSQSVRVVGMDPDEQSLQLYLAVHRTLLKSDRALLNYHLFMMNAPGWQHASEEQAASYGPQLEVIRHRIDAQLQHPHAQ